MENSNNISKTFEEISNLDKNELFKLTNEALASSDDGELFLEIAESEAISIDDGTIKTASYDKTTGFGLRGIVGEKTSFSESSDISKKAIQRAAETVKGFSNGSDGSVKFPPTSESKIAALYENTNPVNNIAFNDKVNVLQDIDKYLRDKDPRVKQVTASLSGEWQAVQIFKKGDFLAEDARPLVRLQISVVVEQNGKMDSGSMGVGGRLDYTGFLLENEWQTQADEALRQALVNLEAVPAPAGEMPVILGPGWPAVLLHEAVGHGLEGDFHRKGTSVFSNMIGQQVASKGVTVIDDGTMNSRRGSLNIDDEGTPTKKNVLIEDGILVGLMQDRQNAALMGMAPTGNGRRESYCHKPMPRMTNTYMANGKYEKQEVMESVKDGIYAVNFGGGQVDITSGRFVFSATEAYKIENGKVTVPIKGCTLVGTGIDVMSKIDMVANDMQLDKGVGTCGKNSQGVPVGVGQPTLKISSMTIGGTEV